MMSAQGILRVGYDDVATITNSEANLRIRVLDPPLV
jgi:hypothetical protein